VARGLLEALPMTTPDVLDPTSLDSVTGGTAQKAPTGTNSALVSQLTGLQSSIKDLAAQQPQRAFGGVNTVLLFAALAANRPAAAAPNVVYVRRGYW